MLNQNVSMKPTIASALQRHQFGRVCWLVYLYASLQLLESTALWKSNHQIVSKIAVANS